MWDCNGGKFVAVHRSGVTPGIPFVVLLADDPAAGRALAAYRAGVAALHGSDSKQVKSAAAAEATFAAWAREQAEARGALREGAAVPSVGEVKPARLRGDPGALVAGLVEDFKRLRFGEGVWGANVADRTGPLLRELCGIGRTASAGSVRTRLRAVLVPLAARLGALYREPFLSALALAEGDDKARFLDRRVELLAVSLKVSDRTVRRRMDMSFALFAQIVVE